jgi:hypothetical protein
MIHIYALPPLLLVVELESRAAVSCGNELLRSFAWEVLQLARAILFEEAAILIFELNSLICVIS